MIRQLPISVPAGLVPGRDRADLVARVQCALGLAGEIVDGLAAGACVFDITDAAASLHGKVVAETAMLLHAVTPRGTHAPGDGIADAIASLAQRLAPLARGADAQAALCLDPANALEHAMAHVLLSRLGWRDASFDDLLQLSLRTNGAGAPERLPCRRLERLWLARLHEPGAAHAAAETIALADSAAGQPLDALQLGRDDVYAFTHAVFYATDAGQRPWPGRRSRADLEADAIVALGLALDEGDHDLTAEVLWTWPMLGLRWHPAALFAFDRIAAAQDAVGLLPGRSFDPSSRLSVDSEAQARHRRTSCYHATYVFAFLCAAALRVNASRSAPVVTPAAGSGEALRERLGAGDPRGAWSALLRAMGGAQLDALAPLLLAVALRRAARAADFTELRGLLQMAESFGLGSAPACRQAAGLLMRGRWLAQRPRHFPEPFNSTAELY